MTPEQRLHLLGPYLPTDRFRALLHETALPFTTSGAALLVDISGFTPMTSALVSQYGGDVTRRGRASEELRHRVNPMFEAVAGQVFSHGGSVIRFMGDGFLAWFDDRQIELPEGALGVPALYRAVAAGLEMQAVMRFFKGLKLKVAVGNGVAHRSVVGEKDYGLMDIVFGPAIEEMQYVSVGAQPGQVMAAQSTLEGLRAHGASLTIADGDRFVIAALPDDLIQAARTHRWPAWNFTAHPTAIIEKALPYLPAVLRGQIEVSLTSFVGELRDSIPMFISFESNAQQPDEVLRILDENVLFIQTVLEDTGGWLVSIEVHRQMSIVFCAFGAPITHGDDAERAVSAALALHDWAHDQKNIHSLKIGLSRGLLYGGIIGGEVRHEYSTIGDETNLAARLMDAAAPGQILVTSRIRNETRQRVKYHDLPPIRVKGREDEIAVSVPYERVSGSHRRPFRGELVGRTHELSQMVKALRGLDDLLPRMVRIEGQAGIGKSRLVAELERLALERNYRVVSGDCLSTERNIPYLPWREIIGDLIGIAPDENGNEESLTRLALLMTTLNPEWSARLPLVGDVLGMAIPDTTATVSLKGETRRQAVFSLVLDIVLTCCQQQPLVIILDDIHWIDEVSEALTIELALRLKVEQEPVMLAVVHRAANEMERKLELVGVMSEFNAHTLITLGDLTQPEVGQLIESHLKAGAPPELVDFVYRRAQGNPFFIKEILDTLQEDGVIQVAKARASIERDLNASNLPRTVQEIIQARIDRLREMEKLVLRLSSVVGYTFQLALLPTILLHIFGEAQLPAELEAGPLLDIISMLEERDFIHPLEGGVEGLYSFKHAIIYEVVYQSLLYTVRTDLHKAVGTVLEAIQPEAVERLAHHFSQTPDKFSTWKYLRASAAKTQREYANHAALAYSDKLLELGSRPEKREALGITDETMFEIHSDRLQVMLRMGSIEDAQTELGELARYTEWSRRTDWQVITRTFRARYFMLLNRWADALTEAADAVTLATAIEDDLLSWDAYLLLCEAYRGLNMRTAVQSILAQLHVLVERLHDPRKQIRLILQELDDIYPLNPVAARQRATMAVIQADELDDRPLLAECLDALGTIQSRDHDRPAALASYRRQLTIRRQIGDRRGEGNALINIGILMLELGQFSDSNAYLLDGYKILRQVGAAEGEARALVYLGVIAWHRRAYDEALAYTLRGVMVLRALNTPLSVARSLMHVGNIYLSRHEWTEAAATFNEARAFFDADHIAPLLAEVDVSLAEIDLANGDLQAARQRIKALYARLGEMRLDDLLQPALAAWRTVQVLDRVGDFEGADRLRAQFMNHTDRALAALDTNLREKYVDAIWYRRALLAPVYSSAS